MIARTGKPLTFRPRLVLALTDTARAALSSRHFRRLGWEVHQTSNGPEARRLAHALHPQVVVLDTDLRGESGWLTCAKLTLGEAAFKVVLVGDEVDAEQEEFARHCGAAAIVCRSAGLASLVEEVHEAVLPTP
ncbi:MAG: response regulator [Gemmataceae bacterium]|nr:response regulator [Gemmataceae bacterium]